MEKKFRVALIVGSVRENRQGIKVAKWLKEKLKARGHQVLFIDPKEKKLPFIDKMYKEFEKGKAPKELEDIHQQLEKAEGFILVTPEYNHSVSPALKNILDHFQAEFFFKPAGIAGYSVGSFAGIRAIEHLRLICLELGMVPTPIAFTVSKVDSSFEKPGQPVKEERERMDKRAEKFLSEFEWYLEALKNQKQKRTPY